MMTSRQYLCLVLAVLIACAVGENGLRQQADAGDVAQRRQLKWTWWDFLNLVGLPHPPCPPDQGGIAAHGNCTHHDSPTSAPASSVSSVSSSTTVSQESSLQSSSRMASWWWLLAAAVGAAAIGAAVWGRKKMRERHMLEGSVKRRMGLFSRWADNNLCGEPAGTADNAVELTGAEAGKSTTYQRMA